MSKTIAQLSDTELLIELSQGNEKALSELYHRHSGRVLSYCLKRKIPRDRAEDVLQIVFMQVYRKKHLYDPQYAALAWLFVITRSELKDYRQREMKDSVEFEESLSQTDDLSPKIEARQEAAALLKELSPKEQEVVRYRYLDELEYKEIAEILNESESNVRQIVSRSLRFLKSLTKKGV